MQDDSQSFSPSEPPKLSLSKPAGSGLTLVIPSLKSLKASQITTKKSNLRQSSVSQTSSIYEHVDPHDKKILRPIKLKPLKEVLAKLIVQIKRKDDYAFFLTPVDTANVPGYTDVVKIPMDFGTMTHKVARGKYRSLTDFTSDFKLVVNNAKLFNPPNSIYYAEAERIETWGLDHITKAASTVIQYETDWTIDVEKDDDDRPVNIDQDEDEGRDTPMDVDGSTYEDDRSVSVAPSQPVQMSTGRVLRGMYKREKNTTTTTNALSETLDADGGLPGSKDGIGAFPSCSDWAKTMLSLKLKGKRYKTKKERLRIERDGPPLLTDGSLNYSEMEDPFSVLSVLVPDLPSRPHLLPLYPPLYQASSHRHNTDSISARAPSTQPPSHPTPSVTTDASVFLSATALSCDHKTPSFPFLTAPPTQLPNNMAQPHTRRRHWVISRTPPSRQKGKERDDDSQDTSDTPAWQTPREPSAVDFGSFSILTGTLAEEMARRGISSSTVGSFTELRDGLDQELSLDLLKRSLDIEVLKDSTPEQTGENDETKAAEITKEYWTDGRAAEAEEYIRDMVYGGVEGFAYIRSLAEFIGYDPWKEVLLNGDIHHGINLASWVTENIVDPLTEGRHSLLRETAIELNKQKSSKTATISDPRQGTVSSQVLASLHMYPTTLQSLSSLLQIRQDKIDIGALLKAPHELLMSDEEWLGREIRQKRKKSLVMVKQEDEENAREATELEEPERSLASVDADFRKAQSKSTPDYELEPPEELNEVLDYVANNIVEVDKKTRAKNGYVNGHGSTGVPHKGDQTEKIDQVQELVEDPVLRNLRLNLLALAKRAPLDTIARLPKDLVPAHIRHYVPTVGSG